MPRNALISLHPLARLVHALETYLLSFCARKGCVSQSCSQELSLWHTISSCPFAVLVFGTGSRLGAASDSCRSEKPAVSREQSSNQTAYACLCNLYASVLQTYSNDVYLSLVCVFLKLAGCHHPDVSGSSLKSNTTGRARGGNLDDSLDVALCG